MPYTQQHMLLQAIGTLGTSPINPFEQFSFGIRFTATTEAGLGGIGALDTDAFGQNMAGSLETLRPAPGPDARLYYDARDVPFLREDEKDSAEIAEMKARTIRTYVDGGYTPESAKAAVESGDEGLLEHTGYFSVQLQAMGQPAAPNGAVTPDEGAADA